MNSFPSSPARGRPGLALREWSVAAGVSFLVAVCVVSPFFAFGTASGHDIAFHMASWLDAAGQWKQGIWLPRWTEWANFGYGEPRFIFYPPLSWMLGAGLGNIVPWDLVAGALVVCVQTFAGISAFALCRRFVDSWWAALFGAACFAANPYALLIVYARSDFAELLAMAFFPLLFLGAFRLGGFLARPDGVDGLLFFALPFSAVWLSNAPAAVVATYGATFFFAFAALGRRSPGPLLRGAAGMLLGFALAGFYLIPALYEQRWVSISGALAGGLTPAENFLYARTTDAEHDAFNRVASNVALALLAWAALCAAAVYWRERKRTAPVPRMVLRALALLTVVVLLLMLPVTAFAWKFLPELRFVQFPWRFMAMLAVSAAVLTAAAAKEKWKWVAVPVAALLLAGCGRYLVRHTWWDTEDMPTLEAAVASGDGFEGTDEYDPVGDDHSELARHEPRAWFAGAGGRAEARHERQIFADRWTAEHRVLRVISARSARVAVRLLDYPAWRVTVNGSPASVEHPPDKAQMIVSVPGGESRIEIRFARTLDRVFGGWISVLAACGSIGWLAWRRKRPPVAGGTA